MDRFLIIAMLLGGGVLVYLVVLPPLLQQSYLHHRFIAMQQNIIESGGVLAGIDQNRFEIGEVNFESSDVSLDKAIEIFGIAEHAEIALLRIPKNAKGNWELIKQTNGICTVGQINATVE